MLRSRQVLSSFEAPNRRRVSVPDQTCGCAYALLLTGKHAWTHLPLIILSPASQIFSPSINFQGTGRWPEKTSGGPEGRFHPPELRETTCAVALKWLLTQGVDGPNSVAASGGRDDGDDEGNSDEGDGEGGGEVGGGWGGSGQGARAVIRAEEVLAERALEYRKCGRELFTRLLASGESALAVVVDSPVDSPLTVR